ncbi:MAG: flagellar basal body P-ring protein FlgI [Phycisphaeraceae bacterium]
MNKPTSPTHPRSSHVLLPCCLAVLLSLAAPAGAVQVQDMVRLKGTESSKLVGMGLVVGLKGTGDGGKFTPAMRPLAAMMQRLMDPNVVATELKDVKNVAIVTLTAKLPAGTVREGDTVDIQIASIGAASSLKGGRLFMTPLYGPIPGSPVYAFADGAIEIENDTVPTVGLVKRGATLTKDIIARNLDPFGRITLVIDEPNATWPMANTIATLINDLMSPDAAPIAQAVDPKNVVVQVPPAQQSNPAPFISQLLEIHLDSTLVRTEARVVINSRTGTIVMTGDVEISPVVVSHKGLTITTITPPPVPNANNPAIDQQPFLALDPAHRGGAKLADLMAAMNQLKVPPEDRIEIIKEIHRSGKLHAKLVLED